MNASGVDANITVNGLDSFIPEEAKTASDGLTFKVGVSDTALSSYSDLDELSEYPYNVGLVKTDSSINIYVCYKWKFGDGMNDEQDTSLGEEGKEFNFITLTITAEQAKEAVT